MREDQFLRQRLQKEIPIEISPVLNHFCYFRNNIANKTIRTNPTTRLTYQERPLPPMY